jgi:hypothetical protein
MDINKQKAIKELIKFKKEKPELFKEIMESFDSPECFLYYVGVLPIGGASKSEFQTLLNVANHISD